MKKRNKSSFTTRHGIILCLSIGLFTAVIVVLVYYFYVLPMDKSM
jgi:hypothetical protein